MQFPWLGLEINHHRLKNAAHSIRRDACHNRHLLWRKLKWICCSTSEHAQIQEPRTAFFPMPANLAGKKCVVAGAGRLATQKIAGSLLCAAEVLVVAPHTTTAIECYARAKQLIWRRRTFSAHDLDGAFLAIAATNSSRVNATVFRACSKHGILCNSVDDPEHCHPTVGPISATPNR
jgi:hypothetical protein